MASRSFCQTKTCSIRLRAYQTIKKVLTGDDVFWKYFILMELMPEVKNNVISSLQPELKQIAYSPSEDEKSEEIDEIALKYLT
ncbi:MAG: hypothetical protein BalsKO_09680 [Balneolaceae bacterium]